MLCRSLTYIFLPLFHLFFGIARVPAFLEQLHKGQGEHDTGGETHQGHHEDNGAQAGFIGVRPACDKFFYIFWVDIASIQPKEERKEQRGYKSRYHTY